MLLIACRQAGFWFIQVRYLHKMVHWFFMTMIVYGNDRATP